MLIPSSIQKNYLNLKACINAVHEISGTVIDLEQSSNFGWGYMCLFCLKHIRKTEVFYARFSIFLYALERFHHWHVTMIDLEESHQIFSSATE